MPLYQSDPVFTITVAVSSSNILNMFATPVTVIPAAANQIPMIISCVGFMDVTATAYANGGAVRLQEETSALALATGFAAADVNGAADSYKQFFPTANTVVRTAGKAVQISNQTAAFITGTGTMTLYIVYQMVNL